MVTNQVLGVLFGFVIGALTGWIPFDSFASAVGFGSGIAGCTYGVLVSSKF